MSAIPGIEPDVVTGLLHLARNDFARERLDRGARSACYCSEPVHLAGYSVSADRVTREIITSSTSADQPMGALLKACGNRRATRCPACSRIYQGDARVIVKSGMCGGKGVEEEAAAHPMVFLTLTAPSFGPVHRRTKSGRVCHGGVRGTCPHGRPTSCARYHTEDDPALGQPMCPKCYHAQGAVLFNAHVSELWRRTVIYTRRRLATMAGITAKCCDGLVKLSYVKVAELQQRGVVHLHCVLRLDGANGGPPPAPFTADTLGLALRVAASQVRVPYEDGRGEAAWGDQIDCSVIETSDEAHARRVANYLAKYATKGSEDEGALDRRITSLRDLGSRQVPEHLRALAEAAWLLGGDERWRNLHLGRWAHTLGLRCHFMTKSRHFSTTFKALRTARHLYRRSEHLGSHGATSEDTVTVSAWEYCGRGWWSRAERFYVTQQGQREAEARRFVYEAQLMSGAR